MAEAITNVGVVGAGTMGGGIAQILIKSGYSVTLNDVAESFLAKAADRIAKGLAREVDKARMTAQEREEALARLKTTTDFAAIAATDFVIEAVIETFEAKASVFKTLDPLARPEVVFSSNTSSISITKLAAATKRPAQFIGLHFFNPVPVMKLVEVVPGFETSAETIDAAMRIAAAAGKSPIRVNDYPGFVSNRVLMPMINEAVFCVMEGVGDAAAVDGVMKLGMNHPMGPLELADLIGLDVCLDIMRVLHEGFGDSKYRPCPLLEKMVAAGRLGRKSGKGFYEYPATK